MIKLYTIGFSGKSAEAFFTLLRRSHICKIVDTRANPASQLSGFAKGPDLKFFAKEIGNIDYEQNLEFAPTKDLLIKYRQEKISWREYETEYLNLLDMRKVAQKTNIEQLDGNCLLCSEHTPDKCHRRLLAEYLQQVNTGIEVIHLIK